MTFLVALVVGVIVVGFILACGAIGLMAGMFVLAIFAYPFVWLAQVFQNVSTKKS